MKLQWLGVLLLVGLFSACSGVTPSTNGEIESLAYVPLGGALDKSLVEDAIVPAVALFNNNPVVAWQESDPVFAYNAFVKKWNGASWTNLPALDKEFENSAGSQSIAFSGGGTLYAAWNEFNYFDSSGNPVNTGHEVFVSRWNGSSWLAVGAALDTALNRDAIHASLALNNSGQPIVAWQECATASVSGVACTNYNIRVKRWSGSNWVSLGSTLDKVLSQSATEVSLAIDNTGFPVVTWQEGRGLAQDIIVKRWNGSSWALLGTLDVNLAEEALTPSLVIDKANRPVVAWQESDPVNAYNLFVKRFQNGTWVRLGSVVDRVLSESTGSPSLAINSEGNPVVAFDEFVSPNFHNVYVRKWNGSSWQDVGSVLDNLPANNAIWPSLALTSLNKPIVAWQECNSAWPCTANNNVYVKRLQ
jgi:hypothetical protein